MQIVDDHVYAVYCENDGSYDQIWTAMIDLSLTDVRALTKKRTSDASDKPYPQLCTLGEKMHYIWSQYDGTYYQIWTATATDSAFSPGAVNLLLLND